MKNIRPALLALAAASATLLSACVVVPAHQAYGYAPGPVVVAPMAPPPPQVEVVPALPFLGAIWIAGYWNWVGGRHVWQPGHYEQPRPGYRWEAPHWEPHAQGGWGMHGGQWRPVR